MVIVTVINKHSGVIELNDLKEYGYRHFELKDGYLVLSSKPIRLTKQDVEEIVHLLNVKGIPILPIDYKISSGETVKVHPFRACQACHKHLADSVVGLCSQCRVKLGNEMKAPVIDNDEDDYEARKLWKKDKNN